MAESSWAGLVYSRTSRIDFRFIALPPGFLNPDRQAAYAHIQATTALPEKLDERPIWSVYHTPNFFVFGVTCSVNDLLGSEAELYRDYLADQSGRPIYLFAGYATPRNSRTYQPLPEFTDRDLRLFRPLYRYIQQAWPETSKDPIEALPATIPPGRATPVSSLSRRYFVLNSDAAVSRVWPHSIYNCTQLWRTISEVCKTETELSLCLGLPRAELAERGPFGNATVDNQRPTDLLRAMSDAPVSASKEGNAQQRGERESPHGGPPGQGRAANHQAPDVSLKSSGESRKSSGRPSSPIGATSRSEEGERKSGTASGSLEAAFKNVLRSVFGGESTARNSEKPDNQKRAPTRKQTNNEPRRPTRRTENETLPARPDPDEDDDFTL